MFETLQLAKIFDYGKNKEIDFEHFLSESKNPDTRKYLDVR